MFTVPKNKNSAPNVSNPAFTEKLSVPASVMTAGAHAPIVTPNFGGAFSVASVNIAQGDAWANGHIVQIQVSIMGAGSRPGPTFTLAGGTWRNKSNVVITESALRFPLLNSDRVIQLMPTVLVQQSIGFRVLVA